MNVGDTATGPAGREALARDGVATDTLRREHVREAGHVLAESHQDYPSFRHLFPDPDRRRRALRAFFHCVVRDAHRFGASHVAGRAGDRSRGEARFIATCSTCHRRGETPGATVGPDLADVDRKFDRNGLIEAIVSPGAAIAFGYGAELFVTTKNEPAIGFLQSEGATMSAPARRRATMVSIMGAL